MSDDARDMDHVFSAFHDDKLFHSLYFDRNNIADISDDIPTLSKTTVYNTLKTFQDSDVVQAVTIEDNEVRYDADIDKHAHFKCTKCGHLYDIEMDTKVLHLKSIGGHLVRESHLYFKGICNSCQ